MYAGPGWRAKLKNPADFHESTGIFKTGPPFGCIPWLSFFFLAAVWQGNLQAGSLEKIWEVDLKKALQGEHFPAGRMYKVKKLLFSPDSEQIAIFLLGGNIELVRAHDPKTILGKFENNGYDSFGWSPDSQTIYTGRHIVHLPDQKACDLPPSDITPQFIGKGSLVAFHTDPQPTQYGLVDVRHPGPAHLKFYDTDCQERDNWEVPSNWLIMDASPDRGLLMVSVVVSSPWTTQLIADAFAKKILHSWPEQDAPRGRFFDQGKAICSKVCWDVDTGKKIVPDHSIRVIVDDYRNSGIPFSSTFEEMAARRKVWDIQTGKEVVSWRLKFITYSITFDLDGYNRDRRPIPSAISPDGEYVVEGGDGKIWLYRIQP